MIPRLYEAKEINFQHNGLGLLADTISCNVIEEQNGIYELELTYKVGSFLCHLLVEDNIIKAKSNEEHEDQLFRIYYVSEEIDGTIQVKAEHISYDLRGNFLENIFLSNVTCQEAGTEAFNRLEESHNFTFYSDIEHTGNYNISRANGLECVAGKRGSLLDTFGNGAKLVRDNFNISLVKSRGENNNVLISYKKNLIGYERELDLTDLVTKIYPFAIVQKEVGTEDNPQTIEELIVLPERFLVSENYNKYANGKIVAVDYSSEEGIDTIEKLRNVSSKYFSETNNDEPGINYKVEFIDLSKTTEYKNLGLDKLEKVCLDDTVIIKDSRFNRNVEARVIKTIYNSLTERYESIELGKFKDSLKLTDTDLNEKVDNTVNSIKNMLVRFEVLDDKVISEVSRLEGDIKTNTTVIEQTDEYIKSVATDLNGKYTSIKQTIDEIDLTGVVKFSDLSTSGGTTIHGSNILTGSITSDKIDVANLSVSGELLTGVINGVQGIYLGTGASIYGAMYGYKDRNMTGGQKWEISSDGWGHFNGGAQFDDVVNMSEALNVEKNISCNGGINAYGGINVQTSMSVKSNINTTTDNWRITSDGWCYFKDGGQFASSVTIGGLLTANGNINTKDITLSGTAYIKTINSSSYNWRVTSGGWVYASGFESAGNVNVGGNLDVSGHTYLGAVTGSSWSVSSSGWCKFAGGQFTANTQCDGRFTAGSFYTTGGTHIGSDIRIKDNIQYLSNEDTRNNNITTNDMHEFIEALPLASYSLKEEYDVENNKHYGFIIQDIADSKVGKEIIVNSDKDEYMCYSQTNFVSIIVGALQEEIKKRKALEEKINSLI